jgi:hypothetical protein
MTDAAAGRTVHYPLKNKARKWVRKSLKAADTGLSLHITVQGVNYTLKPVPGGTVPSSVTWGSSGNYSLPQTISAFHIEETEITCELWKAVYEAALLGSVLSVPEFRNIPEPVPKWR